jgi:polyisoprenoid-binding protein YceI
MTQNTKSTWKIDSNHSLIQFKVKHLAISNVSGTFNVFKGDVQTESEDFSGAEIQFVLDTNSVDTNNSDRDAHLKSDAFFNAPKFPTISFNGKLHKMEDEYQLEGELTLLETTKVVKLNVEYSGTGKGRFGDTRAGFDVNGKINRKDFGLNFGLLTETGNLVVGEEVKLHFDVQLIKQVA